MNDKDLGGISKYLGVKHTFLYQIENLCKNKTSGKGELYPR